MRSRRRVRRNPDDVIIEVLLIAASTWGLWLYLGEYARAWSGRGEGSGTAPVFPPPVGGGGQASSPGGGGGVSGSGGTVCPQYPPGNAVLTFYVAPTEPQQLYGTPITYWGDLKSWVTPMDGGDPVLLPVSGARVDFWD